jgi:hypothetical protein
MGKFRRQKQPKNEKTTREWRRSGTIIKHHMINRCRGGGSEESNLLRFDSERERAWHFLFGNLSFEEAANLLLRCSSMKTKRNSAA